MGFRVHRTGSAVDVGVGTALDLDMEKERTVGFRMAGEVDIGVGEGSPAGAEGSLVVGIEERIRAAANQPVSVRFVQVSM